MSQDFIELIRENDYLAQMAFQRREGHAEGRMEERMAIASNLKKDGMSLERIMEYTGLTVEQIIAL